MRQLMGLGVILLARREILGVAENDPDLRQRQLHSQREQNALPLSCSLSRTCEAAS